jgi:PhzF family phenazine biosynthesis protein
MKEKIYQVDSFTQTPYSGNPAGVCVLENHADDSWMQNIACEMNCAETAFLVKNGGSYKLRWFSPAVEVELCGHATLAAAHILWETESVPKDKEIIFNTLSGRLTARMTNGLIWLDFPTIPAEETAPPLGLERSLGEKILWCGKNRFDYLIELTSEEAVRQCSPDYKSLRTIPMRGCIITSRASSPAYNIVSRFFAPAIGIDEDPVTGSAHCCLAPFWHKRLDLLEFTSYQASKRGGYIHMILNDDRVMIGGSAVTIFKCEIY